MLKTSLVQLFLLLCLCNEVSGYFWEFEQRVVIDGVLKRAERTITTRDSGKTETKIEKSIVLVPDKPLVLAHSILLEKQPVTSAAISYPHIEVYLPEEFLPLIERHVQCSGTFQKTYNHDNEIAFHIDTALDINQLSHQLKTVFYEPEEVEVRGMLYEEVYPGPPEYMSVEEGDCSEEVVILTLKDPINVRVAKDDDFNEPEKGVRELQVVFADSMPSKHQMKGEIALRGTLYHAHTAHHRRRVLMMVKSWKGQRQIPYVLSENYSPVTLRSFPDYLTSFFRIFSASDLNQREFFGDNLNKP
jgi:hypothetical protein